MERKTSIVSAVGSAVMTQPRALSAELTVGMFGLAKGADLHLPFWSHERCRASREQSVERTSRIKIARVAMAEAHHDRFARQFDRDAAAAAASGVCTHWLPHAIPASDRDSLVRLPTFAAVREITRIGVTRQRAFRCEGSLAPLRYSQRATGTLGLLADRECGAGKAHRRLIRRPHWPFRHRSSTTVAKGVSMEADWARVPELSKLARRLS